MQLPSRLLSQTGPMLVQVSRNRGRQRKETYNVLIFLRIVSHFWNRDGTTDVFVFGGLAWYSRQHGHDEGGIGDRTSVL